jgi:hypothetical protein
MGRAIKQSQANKIKIFCKNLKPEVYLNITQKFSSYRAVDTARLLTETSQSMLLINAVYHERIIGRGNKTHRVETRSACDVQGEVTKHTVWRHAVLVCPGRGNKTHRVETRSACDVQGEVTKHTVWRNAVPVMSRER